MNAWNYNYHDFNNCPGLFWAYPYFLDINPASTPDTGIWASFDRL